MVKKLTVKDILERKKLVEKEKPNYYYSKILKGNIDIVDVSPDRIVNIVNAADNTEPIRANCEVIYECCPIFQDKELIESCEVKDPILVVQKCFCNNVFEIDELAKIILSRYGYNSESIEQVKKQ